MWETVGWVAGGGLVVVLVGGFILAVTLYRKVEQGTALVTTGMRGTKVSFKGDVVFPVVERGEYMDISVKTIEVYRHGVDGLVCKDNMRADIKVKFYIRVNSTVDDVLKVAQSVGCARASDPKALFELFDAKFSEALKTAGKQFDFEALFTSREEFKSEILKVIGTDLNGYILEDAAIDYLEQTPKDKLDPTNILDAEGIKKITEITSLEAVKTNKAERDKEKTIRKEDVEAREAILELDRQLAESEERQKREVASITAREEAEAKKIQEEERLKSETARINAEQEIGIADENKQRQIIVAQKNKQRTEAIETERVEKDRMLEVTERERIVTLAEIDKTKVVETEQKNIQEVIRQRVELEKNVVAEQERIKDTEAFAAAEREKKVIITRAEQTAEEALVKDIKAAEAAKRAAELKAEEDKYKEVTEAQAGKESSLLKAEEMLTIADAAEKSAVKNATAKKHDAEGVTAMEAARGLAEAQVITAQADAKEKDGTAMANVSRLQYEADAKGITDKGSAEANVAQQKFTAEANGITEKAEAMKIFNEAGREHEEFKLELNKERDIELAEINIRGDIATEQAKVLGEALKSANIDIVGGDGQFFDQMINAISQGKSVDRVIDNSRALTDVKETFFNGDPDYFKAKFSEWVKQFGISSDDVRNLSIAGVLGKMIAKADGAEIKSTLEQALSAAEEAGLANKPAKALISSKGKK
ncbi:MAG: flotillin [Verrucomicrobiales bacterium]|nr:flotillin [Verrucomicrobiales bacterium]